MEGILSYLDGWREEANQRDGMTQEEKNRLCISQQTDDGWNITSNFLKKFLLVYAFTAKNGSNCPFSLYDQNVTCYTKTRVMSTLCNCQWQLFVVLVDICFVQDFLSYKGLATAIWNDKSWSDWITWTVAILKLCILFVR